MNKLSLENDENVFENSRKEVIVRITFEWEWEIFGAFDI